MTTENLGLVRPILQSLGDFETTIRGLLPAPDEQLISSTGNLTEQVTFNDHCQIFNRRFQEKPWFIVYCRSKDDIKNTYETAINCGFEIRIRAGGHDHEGECTGTNTILIDVSEMKKVEVDQSTGLAKIGPGNRFQTLTSALAEKDAMIAHGTCATVGISGFIMGGGWGPWTRKHGMCCEWLKGADLVLGDGTTVSVDAEDSNVPFASVPDLLWALRGGGGMSYGLVTEFRIQTFKLPKTLIRFDLTWNPYLPATNDVPRSDYPTIDVLQAWEDTICSAETGRLIGTNLMINARPWPAGEPINANRISHNCKMYGYWEGEQEALEAFLAEWFISVPGYHATFDPHHGGTGEEGYGDRLMSSWARESFNEILKTRFEQGDTLMLTGQQEQLLKEGKPLPPDYDLPAPHKLTSRLVNQDATENPDYYQALLESLSSPLVLNGNRELGLFTYVTLGAIVGDFYINNPCGGDCSFPYPDKLYTIQYQCWWNTEYDNLVEGQNSDVWNRTNRGMDWIETAREFDIPNTTGSFISFKDAAIPTQVYFAQNYQRLIEVKKNFSKDPKNHFRIRKSIK